MYGIKLKGDDIKVQEKKRLLGNLEKAWYKQK